MIVKSYLNIIKNRHLTEKSDVLEGSCNACLAYIYGLFARYNGAVESSLTLGRLIYARKKVEYGRFTCAVRSYKTIELAFFYFYVKIINGFKTAEGYA